VDGDGTFKFVARLGFARGRGRSPVPVPDLSGIGDSDAPGAAAPPSPIPIGGPGSAPYPLRQYRPLILYAPIQEKVLELCSVFRLRGLLLKGPLFGELISRMPHCQWPQCSSESPTRNNLSERERTLQVPNQCALDTDLSFISP
jgi:hypothetical protein